MNRKAFQDLLNWKNHPSRKPLLVKGAKGVGKTWLVKEFGKTQYKNYVYFNLEKDENIKSIFDDYSNPTRIIESLSLAAKQPILPHETLIIFDEIQENNRALYSLKFFCEEANNYHVIAIGRLIWFTLKIPTFYPVGKVNHLTLNPLTFEEFLEALRPNRLSYYESITSTEKIENILNREMNDVYNDYLIIGGMPECVDSWIKNKDPKEIINIQKKTISNIEKDFSKYNGSISSKRIKEVFESIPLQLNKRNEKFKYEAVKKGGRARDFEDAIEWLVESGVAIKVKKVAKPECPLAGYDKAEQFKIFLYDTGLLKFMAGVENASIILKKEYKFKRPLVENYVLQQIKDQFDVDPRYYPTLHHEIDFVVQDAPDIIPIEVKSGEKKISPDFKRYIAERNPKQAIRFSKRDYKKDEGFTNMPLYLACKLKELLA